MVILLSPFLVLALTNSSARALPVLHESPACLHVGLGRHGRSPRVSVALTNQPDREWISAGLSSCRGCRPSRSSWSSSSASSCLLPASCPALLAMSLSKRGAATRRARRNARRFVTAGFPKDFCRRAPRRIFGRALGTIRSARSLTIRIGATRGRADVGFRVDERRRVGRASRGANGGRQGKR